MTDGGVAGELIATLGGTDSGLVLEDMIAEETYLGAVNDELGRSHGDVQQMPEAALSVSNRPASVAAWCANSGIPEPSKRGVAYRILDRHADGAPILDPAKADLLRELHAELSTMLKLPPD